MRGFAANDVASARVVHLWDLMVRGAGIALMLLIAVAYFTGEEYSHTHLMLGYGAAAVVLSNLYWEFVRPHTLRSHTIAAYGLGRLLRLSLGHGLPGIAAMAALALGAGLGACALVLMTATHNFWPAAAVDEMHEAIAWFAIGLVVLHIAIVLIAGADYLEHRVSRLLRRR